MKRTSTRVWSGLMAAAIAASIAPLLSTPMASAAGVPQAGGATVKSAGGAANLSSGNSGTTFTLRLPAGASCGGDSANDGYRVQSYMVPASVDPATLTFNAAGPVPNTVGAGFRQPLYDTTGSPYVNAQTANAATPPGPGPIINIPDFNYGSALVAGDIPAGAYNIGIACTQGPASATQMKEFWNVTKTFTTNGGDGFANVNWSVGAVPTPPALNSVTADDQTLTASFTPVASTPATTSFTATATPTVGSPVTATGASSPITIPGLTNGTQYSVTVKATNTVGDSAASNALNGTPNPARPAVADLAGVPGSTPGSAVVSWTYTGPATTGFSVSVNPAEGTVGTVSGNSVTITGLTPGTLYAATVTPTYASAPAGTPATSPQFTVNSAETVVQDVEVNRPLGALVLTQRCGVYGDLAQEASAPGFPAITAANGAGNGETVGTAPFEAWNPVAPGSGVGTGNSGAPAWQGTGDQDVPNFGEYPYPIDEDGADNVLNTDDDGTANPNYPTHCGVDLGAGKLITQGAGAGQFFAATGRINQVTVVDTRDEDLDWTLNGTMSAFSKVVGGVVQPSVSFSGDHLGWTPKLNGDSAGFDSDLDGTVDYDQNPVPGDPVAPRTTGALGLGTGNGATLGKIPTGGDSMGIAQFDARLKLLIPVTATNGRYVGTLSFTFV